MSDIRVRIRMRIANTNAIYIWPYVAVVILIGVGAAIASGFASFDHLLLILNLASFLGLVSIGQTVVILSGGIDLSVSAVVTIAGVVSATIMAGSNDHLFSGIFISCAIGAVIGLINGVGVAYLKINPMVMTLGSTTIVQGLALIYTNGAPKGSAAPLLSAVASERLGGVVPLVLIIWAAFAVVIVLLLHRTVWGRWVYALGNSSKAAFYSGVDVRWTLISLYVISGLCAAAAGILLTGYTRTSYLNIGDPYQINSIAAVVVGGASILGGSGSYIGTIAGCITMVLIQSILPILSVPEAGRRIISGCLILFLLLLYGRERRRG
jgi:ribose transport system permease protein